MSKTSSTVVLVTKDAHAVIYSKSTDHIGDSTAPVVILVLVAILALVITLCACVFLLRRQIHHKQALNPSSPTILDSDTWSSTTPELDDHPRSPLTSKYFDQGGRI